MKRFISLFIALLAIQLMWAQSSEIPKVDLSLKKFFVKQDGKGDGSSWDKAMSPQTFAYYLPLVSDGTVFHVAEGRYLPVDEDKNGYKEFKINSSVSIIGGYPKTAKAGDASDPKRYKTIFTGDPSGDDSYIINDLSYDREVYDPSNDDINVQSLFTADSTSLLYFYGCGFIGSTVQQNGGKYATSPICGNFIQLEKCEFDVVGTIWSVDKTKVSKLEASECIFRNRPSCSSPSSVFSLDTLKVEKSLFEGMKGSTGGCFSRVYKAIYIENSTFNNIVSSSTLFEGGKLSKLHLLNNTFSNLKESGTQNANFAKSSNASEIKIIGNIFVNCSYSAIIDKVLDNCEVRKNLCSGNTVGTDLDLQAEHIEEVLEWDSTPVLKNNGGFTPTIALKNDFLSDGTPIRFSRLANITTDQRGVSRLDSTCIGAYEIGCENVMIFTVDTVLVGSKLYGQTFTKVGAHDTIVENIHSLNGCDSIITHVVIVIPDQKVLNYYVKTKKAGKGDGSSWENAMDGETFAMYLPFVSEGTTFHVAEGRYLPVEEDKSGYKEFKINSSVSIIGGYSKNAKTGDASDPKRYKTIFTGDPSGDDSYIVDGRTSGSYLGHITDPSNDDINVSALFNANSTSNLYFYGCGFKGVSEQSSTDVERHVSSPIYANFIKLEKCEFDVVGTIWAADKSKVSRLEASECIFRNRPSCSSPSSVFSCDSLKIEKSLFDGMEGHSGGCFARVTKAIKIENSTFNNVTSSSTLCEGSKLAELYLLNNTFNNLNESGSRNANFARSSENTDIKIIGNIFVNCSYSAIIDEVLDNCEVRRNLCSGNTVGTDLDLQAEHIEEVLEWDSTPVLKDNGGFTPTIALKNDFLSDGTPIRFSRLANITTDQRGVSRLDSTCIGAYEIGCENVMIFTVDTVLVGSKLYGQTFTKVGAHDTIVENIHSLNGCDSIITHVVIVIPDQKVLNYYVKTKKAGKGDGSSWENAMDGETFAMYLPFVSEGTTFHVAEGRYLPVNEDENGFKEFKINSSVSVIGGYPTTAKTGDASDPKRYKTIFTGDPSGDDSYIVDGRTSGSYLGHITDPSNDDINVSALFNANSTSNLYFYGCGFKGVTVKYDYDEERHVSSPIYANFIKLEKCEFDVVGTTWAADKSKVSKLEASECIFRNRPSCSSPSSVFSCDSLKIEKSLFDGMEGHSGGCFARVTKAIKIENSTFNNVTSSSTLCEGSKLAELYLLNNTFNNLNESGSRNANFAKSSENTDLKIIGNIFVNCSYSAVIDKVLDNCEVRNNLCSGNTVGTDLDLQAENIEEVLEWDSTPVLKDNGGFTPTIALKKDVLSDGTSIRFSRLAKITTDQRGVSRPDMACVGAYEKDVETVVDEVNGSVCEIYPNPVKDELNVSGVDDSFSYEIVDLTGRTVTRGKSAGTIAVSELSNGVYLLKLQSEKQQACVRFVKQ